MLGQLRALPWGWCRWGPSGKGRSASTFIMFSPSSLPISVLWWTGDFQEIPRHPSAFLLGGDSVLFYPKELCSWLLICKVNTFSVEYIPATCEAGSFNKVTGFFFFLLWPLEEMRVKEWRDKSDNIHPGMIRSYACCKRSDAFPSWRWWDRRPDHFRGTLFRAWGGRFAWAWGEGGDFRFSGKSCEKFNATQSFSSAHVAIHSKLDCAATLLAKGCRR